MTKFRSLRAPSRLTANDSYTFLMKELEKVDEKILDNANAYLAAYVVILFLSFLIVSLDNFSIGTNFTAVLACFNNIGPGLEAVGPTCNFSGYSVLSKLVLCFDMLAGRLEIFPMLVLFSRSTWRRT